MSEQNSSHDTSSPPFIGLSKQGLGKRVLHMTILWIFFGALLGACSEPARGGSLIGLVSGVLAGMIVMSIIGPLLGLMGGQVKATFLGALGGLGLGALAAAITATPNPLFLGSIGLLIGGLMGATFSIFLWWTAFLTRLVTAFPGRR
jgi:hypothetical protein